MGSRSPTLARPDGTTVPFRLTAVFHAEDGTWRLVASRAPIGVRIRMPSASICPT
jgi:hypothetical protein